MDEKPTPSLSQASIIFDDYTISDLNGVFLSIRPFFGFV
jgi:hypothetical protein